ncbi:uncharacterized protein B0T15DRAFT_392495 [Chaetomium strumarium]|uniref:Uncharacterized protein n=1 Tax=Chaetomium strumarium TaxID=1170767 RepID=A0AAJ0GY96_9PEZI|nr:hypothetical protein B0T15DRAFT_392495 [Chaetomium strumarium]
MSRPTPRKARHRHHASNSGPRQVNASDYESDTAQYMENREQMAAAPNPEPARDNTELSLRVLRRYQPSIRSILAIAANAVSYTFLEATQGWEKHGIEGTMFVCEQEPIVTPTGQELPRVCVFVLNRRSMDNLVLDLLRVTDFEVVEELMVFRFEDDAGTNNSQGAEDGSAGKKIIGLWIHADESNTREVHASLILNAWQQGRQAFDAYIQAATAGISGGFGPGAESSAAAASRLDGTHPATRQLKSSLCAVRGAPNKPARSLVVTRACLTLNSTSVPTVLPSRSPHCATNIESSSTPRTGEGDDVIHTAVQTQLSLLSSFKQWLARTIESDGDLKALASRLQSRLEDYQRWLCEVERTPSGLVLEDAQPWYIEARVQLGSDNETIIVVAGPGSEESIEIAAEGRKQAEDFLRHGRLGELMTICRAFSKAQDTMSALLRSRREMKQEEAQLSQPAEATVNTYIRRLQEYNDMKDIGQQLMGLVAENRGVPVRTLYETGEYGVNFPR